MTTLKQGQYFEYPLDTGIPSGGVWIMWRTEKGLRRREKITKMQALALARWHRNPGLYYSRKAANGSYADVRVVGDVDAWHGAQEK